MSQLLQGSFISCPFPLLAFLFVAGARQHAAPIRWKVLREPLGAGTNQPGWKTSPCFFLRSCVQFSVECFYFRLFFLRENVNFSPEACPEWSAYRCTPKRATKHAYEYDVHMWLILVSASMGRFRRVLFWIRPSRWFWQQKQQQQRNNVNTHKIL